MKIGDMVRIKHYTSVAGVIISEPRDGVNVLAVDGTTGKKACEVFFFDVQKVATRSCNDLEVVE